MKEQPPLDMVITDFVLLVSILAAFVAYVLPLILPTEWRW